MLKFDHITVIAPTLRDGVEHVEDCLGLQVPFGVCHDYMATHNHRLQLGGTLYLEVVALDPTCPAPNRARWFGLDDQKTVKAEWNAGRRLRGWVAGVEAIDPVITKHPNVFGEHVPLPQDDPEFAFSIAKDGSLPLEGAAPSLIDRYGVPENASDIPDLGARLETFTLEHPEPETIKALYGDLAINFPIEVIYGPTIRYAAKIRTPTGLRELT